MTDIKIDEIVEESQEIKVEIKKSKVEILLYVAAIIMALVGCYVVYAQYAYMAGNATMYGMGVLEAYGVEGVIQTLITGCFSYFAFAVVTAGIGAIYGQIAPQMNFEIGDDEAEVAEEVVE